jgi:hypothetical protein
MAKQSNDEMPTASKQEALARAQARKRLERLSKKVPHPGTVGVTIFPNPRERRFVIDEGTKDNKNH